MSNKVLGGGYTCINCGKYHRTTTVCNCGDRKKLPEKKAEKIPTAEEFLRQEIDYQRYDRCLEKDIIKALKKFAKIHAKAQAKVISEVSLNYEIDDKAFDEMGETIPSLQAEKENKKSIRNAYPLNNIK